MSWIKKGIKSATSWTKGAGKKVIEEVGDAGEDAVDFVKDVGSEIGKGASVVVEEAGELGKNAFDGVTKVVEQLGDKLPKLPKMPSIKGATGQNFIDEKRAWIDEYVKENGDLIKQAIEVAGALAPYKDEIKDARKNNKPLSDKIMRETGFDVLMDDAEEKGLHSVSVGPSADASKVFGGNGSIGLNCSVMDRKLCGQGYTAVAVSGGASIGADVALNIGFWEDVYNEIGGWSHGIVIAGSYNYGAALAFFWKIGGGAGGDFAGWTVSPQVGMSAELEYNIGYTFN
jgi:hypothetical protein